MRAPKIMRKMATIVIRFANYIIIIAYLIPSRSGCKLQLKMFVYLV